MSEENQEVVNGSAEVVTDVIETEAVVTDTPEVAVDVETEEVPAEEITEEAKALAKQIRELKRIRPATFDMSTFSVPSHSSSSASLVPTTLTSPRPRLRRAQKRWACAK